MENVPASDAPDWPAVWAATASRLGAHWRAGRGHLLTEDTLRLCLIEAVGEQGVAASRLTLEVFAAGLGQGKLGLVVDGTAGTVIELKYPRDSRTGFSPDTMTMGELLRDFCRVAVVDATDRWVTQVINTRLAGYLASAAARHGLEWATQVGEAMVLDRAALEALPRTAVVAIGENPWRLPVTATCRTRIDIADGLALLAYQVDAPTAGEAARLVPPAAAVGADAPGRTTPAVGPASGARAAILTAVDHLTAGSGSGTVTVAEVVAHLRAVGTTYADSTIRTMMTSHMCVDAQGPGIGSYDDLERLGRGEYRRRTGPVD